MSYAAPPPRDPIVTLFLVAIAAAGISTGLSLARLIHHLYP